MQQYSQRFARHCEFSLRTRYLRTVHATEQRIIDARMLSERPGRTESYQNESDFGSDVTANFHSHRN